MKKVSRTIQCVIRKRITATGLHATQNVSIPKMKEENAREHWHSQKAPIKNVL